MAIMFNPSGGTTYTTGTLSAAAVSSTKLTLPAWIPEEPKASASDMDKDDEIDVWFHGRSMTMRYGDLDRDTTGSGDYEPCDAETPDGEWFCTLRPHGNVGEHIAGDGERIVARWRSDER